MRLLLLQALQLHTSSDDYAAFDPEMAAGGESNLSPARMVSITTVTGKSTAKTLGVSWLKMSRIAKAHQNYASVSLVH